MTLSAIGLLVRSCVALQGHGNPVSHGEDRGQESRVPRQALIVLADRSRLLGATAAGDLAAPEHVVRDEQPAHAKQSNARFQDLRIADLVDVVEDQVEGAVNASDHLLGAADEDLDTTAQAPPGKG